MKTFYFNIQAKGGSGKSMLTYLLALKHESNHRAYFIDLDSSVRTSLQQLEFLKGKRPARFATIDLLDSRAKIDRQMLFENLQEQSQKDYDSFYLDFGAPESDQFPSLFSKDYSIEEFKEIQDELNSKFVFNIIIAGGSAYKACTRYLENICSLVNGAFETNIFINQTTFSNHPGLIAELNAFAALEENHIHSIKLFGDFDSSTAPHKNILRKIELGQGMASYAFVEKIKINKELAKL